VHNSDPVLLGAPPAGAGGEPGVGGEPVAGQDQGAGAPARTEDPFQHALGIALKYLSRRDRSVHEVRVRLERSAVDARVADDVIRQLVDQGLLDDARFARLFAEDKRTLEAWGSDRIERGLNARGIPPQLVRDAIGVASEGSELDRALSLLRRRFPTAPQNRRDRDRALGVLLRKGYDSELALDALAAHSREPKAA
jgi:regulatory protein